MPKSRHDLRTVLYFGNGWDVLLLFFGLSYVNYMNLGPTAAGVCFSLVLRVAGEKL